MSKYAEIEEGIKKGEFFLEYMPTFELEEERCVGAEALSRWRRASGVVPPSGFISIIEDTPLSGLLTYKVIESIADDFRDWLRDHDAFISFNVPPEIIGRGGIYYVAEKTGLLEVSHRLVMEIIERGVPDRIAVEALHRAAGLGIRIALDDVGTGLSNALVLSRCNVAMIKLDRSVISLIRSGEPLPHQLEVLSPLLRESTLTVVAEGVETADQVRALRNAGIRLAQGYFFSQPLSADAFKAFFDHRH